MTPDQRAAEHARIQHGVLNRGQALGCGLTEHAIDHRLSVGRWVSLAPGVYAVAGAPLTWKRQLAGALLSRPGTVVAGESAAYLHRFSGVGKGIPVILGPPSTNARLGLGRVIRVTDFGQVATTVVEGFRVTTVAETLWTLSSRIPGARLSELVDQQVAMGSTSHSELVDVLGRVEGSRLAGIRSFREALARIDPEANSIAANVLEAALYRLLSHPTVPAVSRQHAFMLDHPSRVDAYIPTWQLVVEADGRNWHTRQDDFQRDRDRDNQLAARGIVVLRFTFRDLTRRFDESLRILLKAGRHRRVTNAV